MGCHPDRQPRRHGGRAKFKESERGLRGPVRTSQKRAAYDRYRPCQAFEQGGGGGGNPDFSDFMSDIFDSFFGDAWAAAAAAVRQWRERGADLRYNLEIGLEDAFAARTYLEIRVPTSIACEVCSTAAAPSRVRNRATCPTCGGHGKVRANQGFFTVERTCPTCRGPGEIIDDPCKNCHGAGRVQKERTLSVNIPAGVEDGTRIRLAGEGEAGLRGGPAGDLYIFLSIQPHAIFQRDGADLFCRVPIGLVQAALGGEIEVPTLTGEQARVKIPEGTQTGKQFRLKGKGMSVLRSREVGDLYIQVVVETPQKLTARQRELLQEFERESSGATHPEAAGFFGRVKDFLGGIGGTA